ncbi:MAG: hypothetical protein ABI954_14485, partial [Pyrinomonadaceae bacterium]
ILHETREEMSREADYDMDLFAEMVRSGMRPSRGRTRYIRGVASSAPPQPEMDKMPGEESEPNR